MRSDDGPVAPRGGDGAVRTTGATDAQIEAAAYQYLQTCGPVETEVYAEAEQVVRHVAFGLVPTDHRIVRVDDLRALANAMIALRTEWVSANINRHIDRMEGEIKSSQLDELIEAKTNQWNELFPDRVALIDRMTALIGEAE